VTRGFQPTVLLGQTRQANAKVRLSFTGRAEYKFQIPIAGIHEVTLCRAVWFYKEEGGGKIDWAYHKFLESLINTLLQQGGGHDFGAKQPF
jgi:hypothetical protein